MEASQDRHPAARSYLTRRGRSGPQQRAALERLRPVFGLAVDGAPLDPAAVFGRPAPLVVDVGSGTGEATAALAVDRPDADVLAVEVHLPGVANLLRLTEQHGLTNLRVAEGDAVVLLRDMLPEASLEEVRLLFPDPWPKVRHHRRRLVSPAFASLVASRLRPGGRLHVATDWAHYAAQVVRVVDGEPALRGGPVPRPDRPVTRFEQRAREAGREVVDVVAVRTAA